MCKEVVEFVIQQNIEAKERMAEDPKLHIALWTEKPEHWAEFETLEAWKVSMAIESYYCAYKGWHGVKPRWENFEVEGVAMTSGEIDKMTFDMCEQESVWEEELQAKKDARRKLKAAERGTNKRKCYPTLGNVFADVFKELQA